MSDSQDVFRASNGEPANFLTGQIKLSVNGTLQSRNHNVGSMTIGQLVDQVARSRGIRTFSVYVDGRKLLTSEATKPATSFSEVDVVAKDSRGRLSPLKCLPLPSGGRYTIAKPPRDGSILHNWPDTVDRMVDPDDPAPEVDRVGVCEE